MQKITKKSSLNFFIIMTLLAIMGLLFACSGSGPSKRINNYITKLKHEIITKKTKHAPQILDLTPPVAVKYNAKTLKEPFNTIEASGEKKREVGTTNPLLVYPITMLKFIGTLFRNGKYFAYVVTPDNILHQVTVGDLIGDHKGTVSNISYDRLEIIEHDSEVGTSPTQHRVVLKLKDENK